MKFLLKLSVIKSSTSFSYYAIVNNHQTPLHPASLTIYVVTNDAKLFNHQHHSLLPYKTVTQNSLQHRIPIQAQIILNHPIRHLLRHLSLRHLMFRQILRRELGPVDGRREAISLAAGAHVQLLHAVDEGLVDVFLPVNQISV